MERICVSRRQPGFKSLRKHPICTNATRLPPSVDISHTGKLRCVHLIPCLCGVGRIRTVVFEMEARVSDFFIIVIIIRLYTAIIELKMAVKPTLSINCCHILSVSAQNARDLASNSLTNSSFRKCRLISGIGVKINDYTSSHIPSNIGLVCTCKLVLPLTSVPRKMP